MSGGREQNWYPIGKVGWFTQHVREGIEVTAGQLALLQPALAQPYRLDDATVGWIIRVHQNQADRWNAGPGLTPAQRAAVQEYEAAIGELRRLNAEVLAAAGQLKPVTIKALLARSDLEAGIEALFRGWPGTGLSSNGTGPVAVAPERPVTPTPSPARPRLLRVSRRECRTSLSANRGRWHTSSMSVSAHAHPDAGMLTMAAPSGTGALQLPSRTVTARSTCGAQVTA